jgi:dephospho-CoA kinase
MFLIVIGVTGGIGSGKSTVSRILYDLGAKVIDADRIAKDITGREEVISELKEAFGQEIENENGNLDRNRLAAMVFGNPEKLEALNNITHKYINNEISATIKRLENEEGIEIVVIDAAIPVFLEMTDKIWTVTAERKTRIERVMERNGLSSEEVEKRMDSQPKDEEYKKIADEILDNNGPIEELEKNVARLFVNIKANT